MDLRTDLGEKAGLEARTHHDSIEQAKGIMLVLLAIDADQAFARLQQASTDHNVHPVALAAAIVDLCVTPSPIFAQSAKSTKAHVVAFDLLEGWGLDFGHRPTSGMERRFAPSQRDADSVRPAGRPGLG